MFYVISGSAFLRNVRATASEENPSGAGKLFNEKRDGVITLEADKNRYNETVENEDPKEVLPDGEGLPLELLDKLNVKVALPFPFSIPNLSSVYIMMHVVFCVVFIAMLSDSNSEFDACAFLCCFYCHVELL